MVIIQKTIRGFTLIEVLVGTAILGATLLGPVTLLTTSFMKNEASADKLTALYLADEGIELIRRIRDNNILAETNWREGLSDGEYEFDYNDPTLDIISDFSPPLYIGIKIKYDSATGIYSYDDGTDTKFIRKITLSSPTDEDAPIGDPQLTTDRMDMTVLMTWQNHAGGPEKSVQLQGRLYNWQ